MHRLAEDDLDGVLRIYRERLSPRVKKGRSTLVDGASLFWRWLIYGYLADDLPWPELASIAEPVAAFPVLPFAAAHASMVFAALGDDGRLAAMVDMARQFEAGGLAAKADIVASVGAAHVAAVRGDWPGVIAALEPVAGRLWELGGSRAQREVFEDTLVVAYLHDGQRNRAEVLLNDRLARRPSRRDTAWLSPVA